MLNGGIMSLRFHNFAANILFSQMIFKNIKYEHCVMIIGIIVIIVVLSKLQQF